jgi:methylmalonyl-CoA mutase
MADFNLRATWMTNLLATGGISALSDDGHENAEGIVAAFAASGARIACLCSSDAIYATTAEETVRALKDAGAVDIVLAGRPGELQAELTAAGIDRFAFAGMDVAAFLASLLAKIGGNRP